MRKNYVPYENNEEERLEKIKDVLKDDIPDDDVSDDEDEDYDMEDDTESYNTENIQKKSSQNLNVDSTASASNGSNLMLSFIGMGLAKARKVPAWYTDEFVKQYVEYGSQTMTVLGLNISDSLGTMKKLPTWQKYLIFAVISAMTAYFVIPIPSTPNDQNTSTIPQPSSMQYHPTRSQMNRYQQQYVIPPNIAIMQGMDGVVTTTSQTPSKSKDLKNSESINENTANMHSKTSETISHTKDSKNLEMSLTDDQQSSESPSKSKDLKNSESLQQNIEDGNQ